MNQSRPHAGHRISRAWGNRSPDIASPHWHVRENGVGSTAPARREINVLRAFVYQ